MSENDEPENAQTENAESDASTSTCEGTIHHPDPETESILKEHGGYDGIIKEMATDRQRSKREREVERVFSQSMPTLLADLDERCESRTMMLDRINDRLDKAGMESKVSRPTLYNWLSAYDLR